MEVVDVVVLCGGRGSRMGVLTADTPKPLLPIGGRPFLLHLLHHLKQEGFSRFLLAAHYLPDRFRQFVLEIGDELDLDLILEPEPLGTGGALRHAVDYVQSDLFVALNGDTWVSQSFGPVLEQHKKEKRLFTAVAVPAGCIEDSRSGKGVWHLGPQSEVLDFETKEAFDGEWVNAGIYLLNREFVATWPKGAYSLEANFSSLLKDKRAGVFCSKGRLLDIGTPEIYAQADRTVRFSG